MSGEAPDGQLLWESFRESIAAGLPAVHRVQSQPSSDLFVEPSTSRIGLRIVVERPQIIGAEDLAEVDIETVRVGGQYVVEVSTRSPRIYHEFFSFAYAIIDRIRLDRIEPYAAIVDALRGWRELIMELSAISHEREVGAWAELWVLERLMVRLGANGLDAWTGPLGEPHDFRVGDNEFEVKATTGLTREHIINGLAQLVPSPGHQLFLVSLQLEPAGADAGRTLPEQIVRVRNQLAVQGGDLSRFDAILATIGYSPEQAPRYQRRLQLRTRPVIIPMDDNAPRLTRDLLAQTLDADHLARLDDVHYRINAEGLGFEDGSVRFLTLMPARGDAQ